MEVIRGDMTQEEYSEIMAEITKLELEQKLGVDNKEKLKELYKKLEGVNNE